jgi:chemotaxis protein MotB
LRDESDSGILPASRQEKAAWMLTFGDLICLMLTFFVMLYSMQVVETNKWQSILSSLTLRLNPNAIQAPITTVPNKTEPIVIEQPASNIDYMKSVLLDKLSEYPEFKDSNIKRLEDRLIITFPPDSVGINRFISGESMQQIEALANILNSITNRIEVNGFAGDAAIQSGKEWYDAIQIADSITRELHRYGYTQVAAAFAAPAKKDRTGESNGSFEIVIREVRTHE